MGVSCPVWIYVTLLQLDKIFIVLHYFYVLISINNQDNSVDKPSFKPTLYNLFIYVLGNVFITGSSSVMPNILSTILSK